MSSTRWGAGIAFTVLLLTMVIGYRWWTSDERAIRNQMSAIARSLTVASNDGELGPVTRIAALRKALAPEVRVAAGPQPDGSDPGVRGPRQIVGRDAVLALVGQWRPPDGGVTVEFVDVQVAVDDRGAGAEVYCTATVTSRGASGQPSVDARELTVGLTNVDGAWLVSSVQPEETLTR